MLVSLLRLTTAMVPMVQALAPNQALVARFDAVCFGVVDIVPWALGELAPDPRLALEALHTAELLAALRPAQRPEVGYANDAVPLFDYQVRPYREKTCKLAGEGQVNLPV
jgi:hypothetical protein